MTTNRQKQDWAVLPIAWHNSMTLNCYVRLGVRAPGRIAEISKENRQDAYHS